MIRKDFFTPKNLATIPSNKKVKLYAFVESVSPYTVTEKSVYIAKFGDNYYNLALKCFGDEKFWTIIADLNSPLLLKYVHLPVGERIYLPKRVIA
jgi:hypothetical protein